MKIVLIVLCMIMVQACTKPEEKIKNYLANGKTLFEKGTYDKARIEFKNVLQLDSKNAEAYYNLALIDEKRQNWQAMFANLSRVILVDPNNINALLKLSRINLVSNHADEALKHVETALKINPENPDALALKGAVLVKKNDLDSAMTTADQIIKQHPDHIDAISLKTVIYLAKNNTPSALATVDKALVAKPSELALLLLKLRIHIQSKDLIAEEQDYLDLIKRFPDKHEYSYALVKHYSDNGHNDKAQSTLQALIKTYPDQHQPKLVLIDFLMQKSPDLAEQTLSTFISQFPSEPDFYFRQAALYGKQNKVAEAKLALNKVVELKPTAKEGVQAKTMLAKIAMEESDLTTAENLIKEILSVDSHKLEAMLLKAKIALQKGLNDEVISDMRVVLRDFTNSDQAMVLLGQAYLKKNSPELADENFRNALTVNPANFDALMPVVSNLLKNKETARAEELLHKALEVNPELAGAMQLLAQIKLNQKDWTGTQKVADMISAKPQGTGFAKFLSGKISEEQGLCKEAITQYKEALTAAPELQDALRGMVSCYENLKQNNAMLTYLGEFITAHPDNFYPVLLKSQLLAKDKQWGDAITALSPAIAKWPKIPEFYETLASIHLEKKEANKAIAALIKGLENIPNQPRLGLILASAYDQTGDYAKALDAYDTLVAKHPDLDIAVNNLVSLLLDHFNSKENIDRALSLAKRFEKSDQPYFLDSYGWALMNSGRDEDALQVFKNVASKMPNTPIFKYHLGMAYHKTNNKAAAVTELQQALALGAKSGGFTEKEAAEKLLKSIN
ncbi:MAG: tetratricopeptide repeat protein [Methyloglobulus sp.]|nr:tetratricopeptide repeat protein [Methyloglobulus sp.]